MMTTALGYTVLAATTFLLFLLSWHDVLRHSGFSVLAVAHTLVLVGLLLEAVREWILRAQRGRVQVAPLSRTDLLNFVSVVAGTLTTFALSVSMGLGPVVAAGLAGIAATLVLPRYDVPFYCGAFAGMACPLLLLSPFHVLLAGVIAGTVFVLTRSVFNGFGGKLGTIAFIGCLATALLTGARRAGTPVPGWDVGRWLVLYSVIGAVLTFLLNNRLRHSAVISSGLVGLLGGLLLPVIHPATGATMSVMVICASFAGMSSPERVPNELYVALSALICAVVFMHSAPYLAGAGGKLGTIAFGSVIAVRGLAGLVRAGRRRPASPHVS